jgi:SAM-dependent methyltransferase
LLLLPLKEATTIKYFSYLLIVTIIKVVLMDEKDFWLSGDSDKFNQFALSIPSEEVAYMMAYYYLNLKEKSVLDFGCFQGISSENILKLGAKKVLGVDQNSSHIITAKDKYKNSSLLDFLHVHVGQKIYSNELFDAACMTFVHPTIEDKKTLEDSLHKIYDVLKQDGYLMILGLNPDAVANAHSKNFQFYDLTLLDGKYEDGAKFHNVLKLPSGNKLEFDDVCWTTKTLTDILENTGFKVYHAGALLDENIMSLCGEGAKELFDKLKQEVGVKSNTTWGDEWEGGIISGFFSTKIIFVFTIFLIKFINFKFY